MVKTAVFGRMPPEGGLRDKCHNRSGRKRALWVSEGKDGATEPQAGNLTLPAACPIVLRAQGRRSRQGLQSPCNRQATEMSFSRTLLGVAWEETERVICLVNAASLPSRRGLLTGPFPRS